MNPSQSCIQWILSQSVDWTKTDKEIADSLNGTMIGNDSDVAPQVKNTCYPSDILPLLSPESCVKVDKSGFASQLYNDMNTNFIDGMAKWAGYYYGKLQAITIEEYGLISGHISGTHPDPNWSPSVSLTIKNVGRLIDQYDVSASRLQK